MHLYPYLRGKQAFAVLLSLFLFLSSNVFSQHRLESGLNMFRAGDVLVKQQVEYKDPGRTGEKVLWDFSRLTVENDAYKLYFWQLEDDSIITGREHRTSYHYSLSGDSLLLWGFENRTTRMRNKEPELLIKFPLGYGDQTKSHYYGHGRYSDLYEMDAMGTVETEADAYGMMILPSGDTLKNVLRTRTLKYLAEDLKTLSEDFDSKDSLLYEISQDSINYRLATDSILLATETFRWYERGYRYPVFEVVRAWVQRPDVTENDFLNTAFFYPPQDHYYIEDDQANLAVQEEGDDADPWAGLTYNVYPNPATVFLEVELYLPSEADVRLEIASNMGLRLLQETFGLLGEGVHTLRLSVSSLAVGNHVLNIHLGEDYVIKQVIMKR